MMNQTILLSIIYAIKQITSTIKC